MENSSRPRRMRKDEFSRRLMREHHLRTALNVKVWISL